MSDKSSDCIVSVIVLTYNQENTIGRTLESIVGQEVDFDFEVVIGEDGSSDGTRLICEQFQKRFPNLVRIQPPAPNKGLLRNYKECLDACLGKYVACCAGDDWWNNPQKLAIQIGFMESNPDFGLTYTDATFYKKFWFGISLKKCSSFLKLELGEKYENLLHHNYLMAGTVVFKRQLYLDFINFEEFVIQGYMTEDYPMWLELIQRTKFKYLNVDTFTYVRSEGSLSNNTRNLEYQIRFYSSIFKVRKDFLIRYPLSSLTVKGLDDQFTSQLFDIYFSSMNLFKANSFVRNYYPKNNKERIKKLIIKLKFTYIFYCQYRRLKNVLLC